MIENKTQTEKVDEFVVQVKADSVVSEKPSCIIFNHGQTNYT